MPFISIKCLSKDYGFGENKTTALNNATFEIDKGEFVVILGASGAGKSTLLNLLGGMDLASDGSYTLNGTEVTALSPKELTLFRRNSVGFIFQFYNLMPTLTAEENVALSLKGIKDFIPPVDALKAVGLEHRLDHFPSSLSGGEQQRVAIARAIAKKPDLLLCDEPTGALDSKTGKTVLSILKDLSKKDGKTVIIVTHNSNVAQLADRVIKMSDGKIISDETNPSPKDVEAVEW